MRRLTLAFACGAVALLLGAVPASADNGPHQAGAGVLTDSCAGCHRVHTAKTASLTRDTQPGLCYTCHGKDGAGADTDVQDGVGRGSGGPALRGGGFEYALIGSGDPDIVANQSIPALNAGVATTSSHSVDGADAKAWGLGAIGDPASTSIQLRCTSCHDPHGNGNYRILRPLPIQADAADTPTFTTTPVPITETAGATHDYTTTDYWNSADTNEPQFIANVSAWCSTCHTRYLAPTDSGHVDSLDPVFAYRHRSNGTSQNSPNCIKCHVAHGSNATVAPVNGPYALNAISPNVAHPDASATGAPVTNNTSALLRIDNRGTCAMCHP